jgi:nitrite reductase/ring-hydroxylating ferredoxin subunit
MKDCDRTDACLSRREFLVKAGFAAGALVLTVSSLGSSADAMVFENVTIPVGPDSPLAKVGGFSIVDSSAGKIIVIHESDTKFAAFTAKCTHKGALVEYDAEKKQIHCPKHGSRFDQETGAVVKGPAENPLPSYPARQNAADVVVKVS